MAGSPELIKLLLSGRRIITISGESSPRYCKIPFKSEAGTRVSKAE
jgi:hypothetical protein